MSAASRLALAVLISGRGSNMAAIAHACERGQIDARIATVIADRPDAGGIALARKLGIEAQVVAYSGFASHSAFEHALGAAIDASGTQLVVLAGFMRILSPQFA